MGRVLVGRWEIGEETVAPVTVARSIFVLQAAMLALLLGLAPAISGAGSDPVTGWVLVGVGAVLGGTGFVWIGLRPLEAGSVRELRGVYLTRFLVQMAFASSTALMGFVAALVGGSTLHYVASLALSLPMLARAAPTAGRIRAEDRLMTVAGRAAPLSEAVYRPGSADPSGREE